MKGFEPSTFAMARRRSSQLSYIRNDGPFYPERDLHVDGARRPRRRRARWFEPTANCLAAGRLALERRAPEVPERLIAFAHRLAEAGFSRVPLEGVPLARVAGDAIEHRTEHLGGV
jgi:hypothetical protein